MSSDVLLGQLVLVLGCKSTRSPVLYLAILDTSDSPGHLRCYETPELRQMNHTRTPHLPHSPLLSNTEEVCSEPVNMVYVFIWCKSSS